ncbi:helix-turn-helix domain-containing protein [Actinoplanes sp. TBRC 11911]|uniref:helix-turn-helix transcriptional regulator n=1 Tax=Actinoplanes sp. TBRC 11911 TaxID=2729386 RepID=UPI00145F20F0|nr:helix-turn-helix transcriptional regulator [Actinoplanes sp. TBRC 11911]NMO56668.1 helix-turn-helix domain-containing protein [Actinoplanes sp. TBRC 11911]
MNRELGDFLRSRRARLTPAEVGLPERGPRRVAGLRREEVAQLAGLSTDYYVRLEQGRGPHVSDQVLTALGRALRLDQDELAHLRALVLPEPATVRRTHPAGPRPVRASLRRMLDDMAGAAIITDYTMTVWAENALARAVFQITDDPRTRDRARRFFLDEPRSREFYPDWARDAESMVADLRVQVGKRPGDPHLTELIGELSIRSARFRELWASHPVRDKTHGPKVLNHPLVGRLDLAFDRMTLTDDVDSAMYVFTAEPGSPTSDRLALLASWSADATPVAADDFSDINPEGRP